MNPNGYNPGRVLRELFPEQTRTIPRILLWTLLFLADTGLVFWAAIALGLPLTELSYQLRSTVILLLLAAAFLLFSLEVSVYNRIVAAVRKKKEKPICEV